MHNEEKKQAARLTLQALANINWADDCIPLSLTPIKTVPAVYCFYNLEAFHKHFRERFLFIKAFEEICRQQQIEFSKCDKKAWQELQGQRPDLVQEAHRLTYDPEFVIPITEEVRDAQKQYMLFIGEDTIGLALETGINMAIQLSTEIVRDVLTMRTGVKRRGAKERRQNIINIANNFAQRFDDIYQFEKRDQTRNWRFNYQQLCDVTCTLATDRVPKIEEVEQRLGTSNLNRILRNNKRRLMETHQHTDHKWPVLGSEIWERYSKK
ncbi:MAG: hypothetical protein ACR2LC_14320 [Pyrinomonadaceae bacterium]